MLQECRVVQQCGMSDPGIHRYFLAIIPPEPVFSEVQQLKNYFKENYNSKASLNSPPHITLHMPFAWKNKKEKHLLERLAHFATTQHAFEISLENFKAFAPRVIYLHVPDNPVLISFQKEMERFCKREFQLFNANRLDHAYHPHLTLAFRDLKKDFFVKAWDDFKTRTYSANWLVQSFSLLQHTGTCWTERERFTLEKILV